MQIRISIREISAAEYDVALSTQPGDCPLALTGDRRSGRQLLDAAAADSQQTIASLAESAEGLAALDGIAAFLDARFREADLAFGPPDRKRRKAVHRPLPFNRGAVAFHGEGPAMGLLSRLELAQLCARRLFNIGYNPERLARALASLPPRPLLALRRLVVAVQQEAHAVTQRLVQAAAAAAGEAAASSEAGGDPVGGWALRAPGEEGEVWEQETELGLAAVEFDPATQRRVRFACNSRAARIWGQHREEFLARFAAHDGQLQFTDLGAVCRFAAEMRAARDDAMVSYQLFTFGAGPEARALLVKACQWRRFDSMGRVAEVPLRMS